jgi:hypothetical protein
MNPRPSRDGRGRPDLSFGVLALLALLALLASSRVAAAEPITTQQCVASHLASQSQKLEGKLVESQQSLETCANRSCPDIVQRDCVKWLEELLAQVPTVIFEATDAQGAMRDVTVTHQGRVVASAMDGTAVETNPGTYEFVFETADGRHRTARVLVRQGDRNRLVAVDFAEPETGDDAWLFRVPPQARITGGIAVVATGVAIGFGASALVRQSHALQSCAPDCSEGVSRRIATRAAVADVATGVAVVSGVLTAVFVAQASRERPAPTARWRPTVGVSPDAAFLALGGGF